MTCVSQMWGHNDLVMAWGTHSAVLQLFVESMRKLTYPSWHLIMNGLESYLHSSGKHENDCKGWFNPPLSHWSLPELSQRIASSIMRRSYLNLLGIGSVCVAIECYAKDLSEAILNYAAHILVVLNISGEICWQ